MEKFSSSKNRSLSLSKDRSLSLSKDRSLSLSKGISPWKILLWLATGLLILFLVVIIIYADRGVIPAPIAMMYNYAYGDKLGHFFLMGTLAFLVNLSCSAKRISLFSKPVLLGSLFVFIAVVLEEISQLFVPSRSFSWLDMSCDFLGILCASWLISRMCNPTPKTG